MELNMEVRQAQVLSVQQIQSMAILQMNQIELNEHVSNALLENPVLEEEEKSPTQIDFLKKLEWLEAEDWRSRYYNRPESEDMDNSRMDIPVPFTEEDIVSHVKMQLDTLKISENLFSAVLFAAGYIDKNGYLIESTHELAESAGVSIDHMEEAVSLLRSLEPAGLAAMDLKDCLELQLARMGKNSLIELAIAIVRNFLDKVARSQYANLVKELGKSELEIRSAIDLIKTLNPKPGAAFYSGQEIVYIRPDILIIKNGEVFTALTNDYDYPRIKINSLYSKLAETSNDNELKDYLEKKLRQAKWLINCITQRNTTLIRCAEAILKTQFDFFSGKTKSLSPLSMLNLADQIGVHESTVSRAVSGKYLQCRFGVYPLRYFFSRKLNRDNISADGARHVLLDIINGENKSAPLSDQQIVESMRGEGIEISRRAVTKYRAYFNIPNRAGRKLWQG